MARPFMCYETSAIVGSFRLFKMKRWWILGYQFHGSIANGCPRIYSPTAFTERGHHLIPISRHKHTFMLVNSYPTLPVSQLNFDLIYHYPLERLLSVSSLCLFTQICTSIYPAVQPSLPYRMYTIDACTVMARGTSHTRHLHTSEFFFKIKARVRTKC